MKVKFKTGKKSQTIKVNDVETVKKVAIISKAEQLKSELFKDIDYDSAKCSFELDGEKCSSKEVYRIMADILEGKTKKDKKDGNKKKKENKEGSKKKDKSKSGKCKKCKKRKKGKCDNCKGKKSSSKGKISLNFDKEKKSNSDENKTSDGRIIISKHY